ncbi:cell division protein ZapC [Vibrio sp. SCSIO 43132]|uniref:cell division protein ZapC n=1 Tax=Vibrio sp. SCSIO 43132 TaxID=2779363 RepID=UPI001CA8F4D0|nr:cell division protein ZapC [Vibrio sp. SCSIO 43132]UAB68860.1 cell division protein ZapC [Vibrio sp. SCSIO 43132]
MLKPSDNWKWYFDNEVSALVLGLDGDMAFKVEIPQKFLVDCAFKDSEFSVDDASVFQQFKESVSTLPLSEPRQAQLILNCVATNRFHKPVQPKSWFFDHQGGGHAPSQGELVHLKNELNSGLFMVVEVCDNASVCASVELDGFQLTSSKSLSFCQSVKVMHDRIARAEVFDNYAPIALVG